MEAIIRQDLKIIPDTLTEIYKITRRGTTDEVDNCRKPILKWQFTTWYLF